MWRAAGMQAKTERTMNIRPTIFQYGNDEVNNQSRRGKGKRERKRK